MCSRNQQSKANNNKKNHTEINVMTTRSWDCKMNFSPNGYVTLLVTSIPVFIFLRSFGRTHPCTPHADVWSDFADAGQEHPYLSTTDDGWMVKHYLTSLTQQGSSQPQKSSESLVEHHALIPNFFSIKFHGIDSGNKKISTQNHTQKSVLGKWEECWGVWKGLWNSIFKVPVCPRRCTKYFISFLLPLPFPHPYLPTPPSLLFFIYVIF